ncbi:Holliday junction branch migration protein RuvA [Chromatium okenii]|uniref:Holliday junction branch migration protein RuvA n=1 Tax=Chromatium okenii TaxID=61644 RepID=UPI001903EE25|nr:Holliday junction branch migration protein RuvA [Chromatium okenii]MBK1640638.1 Holliday junction branch migration protein RuvA [Chromatium okenii]
MIGQLRGILRVIQPPQVLIEVGGVGYEVELALSAFDKLPAVGEPVTLITHFAVREDAQVLYGFLHQRERALFRMLLKVTGIGARLALDVLASMDAQRLAQCLVSEDIPALMRIPGVGKKTAQRLVLELRDRVETLTEMGRAAGTVPLATASPVLDHEQAVLDAVSALVALGYRPLEANRMVRSVDNGLTTEEMIRAALRQI